MRERIVAGNWKMNTELDSARELARDILGRVDAAGDRTGVNVVLCPPAPFLQAVGGIVEGTSVALGAQNVYRKERGAFTGEISPPMLVSLGCTYVIIGHSERRLIFGESDYEIKLKVNAAIDHKLRPIVCVGETEAEREAGTTFEVLNRQVREAFDGIFDFNAGDCVIAYEPVWAIGTGNTATPEQAQDAHLFIRDLVRSLYNDAVADRIAIVYGGSVKGDNANELFRQPDIDGGLIGGASLNAEEFATIVQAASSTRNAG